MCRRARSSPRSAPGSCSRRPPASSSSPTPAPPPPRWRSRPPAGMRCSSGASAATPATSGPSTCGSSPTTSTRGRRPTPCRSRSCSESATCSAPPAPLSLHSRPAGGVDGDRSKGEAMISSEVQRTLVKSPPELWTELSDPEALARHLGELGEIKITRIEPETLVEWEAEGTTGSVPIKASGWGTKVTPSGNRQLPATEAAEPSPLEETASAVAEEEEEKEKKKKKEEDEEDHHLGPVEPEGDAALPTEIEAAPTEED